MANILSSASRNRRRILNISEHPSIIINNPKIIYRSSPIQAIPTNEFTRVIFNTGQAGSYYYNNTALSITDGLISGLATGFYQINSYIEWNDPALLSRVGQRLLGMYAGGGVGSASYPIDKRDYLNASDGTSNLISAIIPITNTGQQLGVVAWHNQLTDVNLAHTCQFSLVKV